MQRMYVIKSDGTRQDVEFDAILRRVRDAASAGRLTRVDPGRVTQGVVMCMKSGQSTLELDHLAADKAAQLVCEDPEYDALAVRLYVFRMHKETEPDFIALTRRFASAVGDRPILDPGYVEAVEELGADFFARTIDYERDYDFPYIGLRTLANSYLMRRRIGADGKVIAKPLMGSGDNALEATHGRQVELLERPQQLYMRVAVFLYRNDPEAVAATYHALSTHKYTHASPTMFQAGTCISSCLSCFLLSVDDDLASMYEADKKAGLVSKAAGGVGISISAIRGQGAIIQSTGGKACGIKFMLEKLRSTATFVDQGGRRPAAVAVYLEPWHSDIMEFLRYRLKSTPGGSQALNTALWIPDEFMRRAVAGEDWYLFDPSEAPGLQDAVGEEFAALYNRYVDEGRYRQKMKIKDFIDAMLRSMIETGEPYVLFKDTANVLSNQSPLGTIRSSNLCLSGDTRVLTAGLVGYMPIKSLVGSTVQVWNGTEWAAAQVKRTAVDAELLRVTLTDGTVVDCTPNHEWLIRPRPEFASSALVVPDGVVVRADALPVGAQTRLWSTTKGCWIDVAVDRATIAGHKHVLFVEPNGDRLSVPSSEEVTIARDPDEPARSTESLPIVHTIAEQLRPGDEIVECSAWPSDPAPVVPSVDVRFPKPTRRDPCFPFLAGFLSRFSTHDVVPIASGVTVALRSTTAKGDPLADWIGTSVSYTDSDGKLVLAPHSTKSALAFRFDAGGWVAKVRYLAGAIAADGRLLVYIRSGAMRSWLELPPGKDGINARFRDTLHELGVPAHLTRTGVLVVPPVGMASLLVLLPDICTLAETNYTEFDYEPPSRAVASIAALPGKHPTYCLSEPRLHRFVVGGGVLVGNCAEIVQYSRADSASCCNLASISLPAFWRPKVGGKINGRGNIDWDGLIDVAGQAVRDLNRLIDLNAYVTDDTKASNLAHRPIGLGIQGLSDMFMLARLPLDSPEAAALNSVIMETVYFGAVYSSIQLAEKHGSYSSFAGSPFSEGRFQFDLFRERTGKKVELVWEERWKDLAEKAKRIGMRNSLLTALMPTASTSHIMGNVEAFEPIASNVYKRKILAGEFVLVNRHLVDALQERGLWSPEMAAELEAERGSVQRLARVPDDLKAVFKTQHELKMRPYIDLAAGRAPFVDQSQSMNLFFGSAPDPVVIWSSLLYAWRSGLKTGCYYTRVLTATKAQAPSRADGGKASVAVSVDGPVCTRNDPSCTSCSA